MPEQYPLSAKLGLKPVRIIVARYYRAGEFVEDAIEHPGFDIDDVEKKLGPAKFAKLSDYLKDKSVFSVGHRTWPSDHKEPHKRNAEVHCVYGADMENFLKEQK